MSNLSSPSLLAIANRTPRTCTRPSSVVLAAPHAALLPAQGATRIVEEASRIARGEDVAEGTLAAATQPKITTTAVVDSKTAGPLLLDVNSAPARALALRTLEQQGATARHPPHHAEPTHHLQFHPRLNSTSNTLPARRCWTGCAGLLHRYEAGRENELDVASVRTWAKRKMKTRFDSEGSSRTSRSSSPPGVLVGTRMSKTGKSVDSAAKGERAREAVMDGDLRAARSRSSTEKLGSNVVVPSTVRSQLPVLRSVVAAAPESRMAGQVAARGRSASSASKGRGTGVAVCEGKQQQHDEEQEGPAALTTRVRAREESRAPEVNQGHTARFLSSSASSNARLGLRLVRLPGACACACAVHV